MAAYFFDLDGTILHHGTQEPIGNAINIINKLYDDGHQIIFTTRRGEEFKNSKKYNKEITLETLNKLGIKYHHILFDIPSPRIVVNDEECRAIMVEKGLGIDAVDF